MDKVEDHSLVGCNENNEIVLNLPVDSTGRVVLPVRQARSLAYSLLNKSNEAADAITKKATPQPPPVDRSARVLTNGKPVTEDHREIDPTTGMQKAYVVLTVEERAKGFVRPVRNRYTHLGQLTEIVGTDDKTIVTTLRLGGCGETTHMSSDLAETYARDPEFYSGTYCVRCMKHLPVSEFVWAGTQDQVGS